MKEQSSNSLKENLIEQEKPIPEPEKATISYFSLYRFADAKDKMFIFLGIISSLAVGVSLPFFLIFFGDITTVFMIENRDHAIQNGFNVSLKFFLIGGGTFLACFLALYSWNFSGSSQMRKIKKIYYHALLQQQVCWYDSNDVNKLSTEIASNVTAIETAIGEKVFIFLSTSATSVFGFFYAYIKCWQLSLVLTGFLPLILAAGAGMMKAMTLLSQKNKVSYEDAAGSAEQAIGAIRTVKSLVGEEHEENKFIDGLDKGLKTALRYTLYTGLSFGAINLVFLSVYAMGFWYGKQLLVWQSGDYTAATIISTFFCFIIGGSSVGQVTPVLKNFAEGKVAGSHLFKLLDRKKTLVEPQNGIKIKGIKNVNFNNVSFVYKKDNQPETVDQTMVLKNLSLQFKEGKVSAVVGESGSGKSTIVQLLMRYYDPVSGSITVNGTNLNELDMSKYRRKIGFVGQEPVLFAMSIEENLLLANPKLTEEEMIQILKQANAWEFIEKMDEKMKTYVGSSGAQLSGGQKQRIAIARAICKKPKMLVLDEATSALDRKNEKEIQKTLQNLQSSGITTVVIAHRLSTIKNANTIFVLGKGSLLESGTHDQLVKKEGAYRELVESQLAAERQKQQMEKNEEQKSVRKLSQVNQDTASKSSVKQEESKEDKSQEIPKEKLDAVFSRLFFECRPDFGFLFLGCFFGLLMGLIWPTFNIAFSSIFAYLVQPVKYNDQIDNYCLLFLGIAIVSGIGNLMFQFSFGMVGQRLVYRLRKKVYHKLLRAPVSYYDKKENTPGAISTKLSTDAYNIHNLVTGLLGIGCMNFSTVVASLIIAFTYSWQLTLISLALSPFLVVSSSLNMSFVKKMAKKSEEVQKFLGSLISDTVCNIRTVKSFGNNELFEQKFNQKLDNLYNLEREKALKSACLQGIGRGSIMVIEGLIFWFAAMLFQNGVVQDPQAVFIAIFSIIFAAMGVGQNSSWMPDIGKSKHSGANIFDIIDDKSEQQLSLENGGTLKTQIEGEIQFRNVNFKYPERDQQVLNDFSVKIGKGEKIAFVGSSGSGKSTLIQLLERFYAVDSGQILVDGRNINQYDLEHYRSQIGLVSQEPVLFQGTVKSNILYNLPSSKESSIQSVSKQALADKFIQQWEEKYEKEVGSKGSQVSGGQKQRIALARCLLRDPRVILLDEATSALDADSQNTVFENLKSVLAGKTSLSIAHRLSTIEDASKIFVMRDGQIIEEGSYPELMQLKENFYRLAQGN